MAARGQQASARAGSVPGGAHPKGVHGLIIAKLFDPAQGDQAGRDIRNNVVPTLPAGWDAPTIAHFEAEGQSGVEGDVVAVMVHTSVKKGDPAGHTALEDLARTISALTDNQGRAYFGETTHY